MTSSFVFSIWFLGLAGLLVVSSPLIELDKLYIWFWLLVLLKLAQAVTLTVRDR